MVELETFVCCLVLEGVGVLAMTRTFIGPCYCTLVMMLLAAQISAAKAAEENTRLQTALAQRPYKAVSTHDADVPLLATEFSLRTQYPRFIFSALAIPGTHAKPTPGMGTMTTEQALGFYGAVVT